MTIDQLDCNLVKAIEDFSEQTHDSFKELDKTAATKADLSELSREIYYLTNEFRKNIIDYLKKAE